MKHCRCLNNSRNEKKKDGETQQMVLYIGQIYHNARPVGDLIWWRIADCMSDSVGLAIV